MKVLRLATFSVALGGLSGAARAQSEGSWVMKAPIPLARNEVALAAVGGKVHVIGGGIKGVAGTYHDEYDPATDLHHAVRRRAAGERMQPLGTQTPQEL